jgi:hypothetical protein
VFGFLFARRSAQLVHLTMQLRVFGAIRKVAHELATRIRTSPGHQSFDLDLPHADGARRFREFLAIIEHVPVRLDQEAPGAVVGRRTPGKQGSREQARHQE